MNLSDERYKKPEMSMKEKELQIKNWEWVYENFVGYGWVRHDRAHALNLLNKNIFEFFGIENYPPVLTHPADTGNSVRDAILEIKKIWGIQ